MFEVNLNKDVLFKRVEAQMLADFGARVHVE